MTVELPGEYHQFLRLIKIAEHDPELAEVFGGIEELSKAGIAKLLTTHGHRIRQQGVLPGHVHDMYMDVIRGSLVANMKCWYCGDAFGHDVVRLIRHYLEYVLPKDKGKLHFVLVEDIHALLDDAGVLIKSHTLYWTTYDYNIEIPRLSVYRGTYVTSHVLNYVQSVVDRHRRELMAKTRKISNRGATNKVWDELVNSAGKPLSIGQIAAKLGLSHDLVSTCCSYLVERHPEFIVRVKTGIYHAKFDIPADHRLDISVAAKTQTPDANGEAAHLPAVALPAAPSPVIPRDLDGEVETLLDMLLPGGVPAGVKWSDVALVNKWVELTKDVLRRFG